MFDARCVCIPSPSFPCSPVCLPARLDAPEPFFDAPPDPAEHDRRIRVRQTRPLPAGGACRPPAALFGCPSPGRFTGPVCRRVKNCVLLDAREEKEAWFTALLESCILDLFGVNGS